MVDVEELLVEYDLAREHTEALYGDLSEADVTWRPHEESSGIGWHLGHQAAVNHYLLRNLVAAETTLDARFDRLFDSATEERQRGELPPLQRIVDFRQTVAARTHEQVERILLGRVGAPTQLRQVANGLLVALIHHEYQHDTWIGEVRETIGRPAVSRTPSARARQVDGYWLLDCTA